MIPTLLSGVQRRCVCECRTIALLPLPRPIQRQSTLEVFWQVCHSFVSAQSQLIWRLKLLYQKPGEQSHRATGSWFKEIRGRHEPCCLAWGPAYGFGKEVFAMDGSHSADALKPHALLVVNIKMVAVEPLVLQKRWCHQGQGTCTWAGSPIHYLPCSRRSQQSASLQVVICNVHTWGWTCVHCLVPELGNKSGIVI